MRFQSPLQRTISLSLILVFSLGLASCETIKKSPTLLGLTKDSLTITESQFDCGPKAPNLPTPEMMQEWSSATLFDQYVEAWNWGERCDLTNKYNKSYLQCWKGDKDACKLVDNLKTQKEGLPDATSNSNEL